MRQTSTLSVSGAVVIIRTTGSMIPAINLACSYGRISCSHAQFMTSPLHLKKIFVQNSLIISDVCVTMPPLLSGAEIMKLSLLLPGGISRKNTGPTTLSYSNISFRLYCRMKIHSVFTGLPALLLSVILIIRAMRSVAILITGMYGMAINPLRNTENSISVFFPNLVSSHFRVLQA